jgi:A/G-specific adenine glycosylase
MTPDAAYRRWIHRRLLAWYDRHKRDLPWRRTSDPYAVWLSEVMLQQTQVATVIPYYERFRCRFLTVQDLAEADLDEVLRMWAGLGYYARARNLHRAARIVAAEFGGRFPGTVEELRKLPGVGRYVAGAVASMAFGVRSPVVDGNVGRVLARLFGLRQDLRAAAGQKALWRLAEVLLPESRCGDFNQALMELGATVCMPGGAAECEKCPLRAKCSALAAGAVADLPIKAAKRAPKCETHVVAAIEQAGQWFFTQRPARGLWGGLWEMPSESLDGETTARLAARLARDALGRSPGGALLKCPVESRPFCDFTHQLTHRTIRFVGHVCRPKRGPGRGTARKQKAISSASRWLALEDVGSLGLSTAMQKVVRMLRERIARGSPDLKPRKRS